MKKCTKLLLFCDICKYFAIKMFIRGIIVENVTFVWQKQRQIERNDMYFAYLYVKM